MAAEAKIESYLLRMAPGWMPKHHTLYYELTLVGDANHAHLYVDGREATLLRQAKGSVTLDPLAQGKHEICAKLVNKNHTPIGVERCIKITAE